MRSLRQFGAFWYHFIVGDDWRIAVGVIFGLVLTAFMTHKLQLQAWWLLPVLVVTMLTLSLVLATRRDK